MELQYIDRCRKAGLYRVVPDPLLDFGTAPFLVNPFDLSKIIIPTHWSLLMNPKMGSLQSKQQKELDVIRKLYYH